MQGVGRIRPYSVLAPAIKSPCFAVLWSTIHVHNIDLTHIIGTLSEGAFILVISSDVLQGNSVSNDEMGLFHDKWGPRPHGMARPQVADGGTASNMEGSCEYIE